MKIKGAIISSVSLLGIAFLAKHALLTKEAREVFLCNEKIETLDASR